MKRRDVVVTGSVAYDYLMTFPGKFVEHFLPDQLNRISVSFLVDDMRRVRGGCAPNIAYSLAQMGEKPKILAAGGRDAVDYREWLGSQGVDVEGFRILEDLFTASFFVSTDVDQNQIASFYMGAMARAAEFSLLDFDSDRIAFVIIAPNDPSAMARYARECRESGIPFLYDPSQQVARLSGGELADGMHDATVLICNDYEAGMIRQKTGFSDEEILGRVGCVITTHGPEGSTIRTRHSDVSIRAARLRGPAADPTGVGDAYRGALLKGMLRGDSWEFCGRIASVAAAYCLEAVGPQPPRFDQDDFRARYRENYGDAPELSDLFDPILE